MNPVRGIGNVLYIEKSVGISRPVPPEKSEPTGFSFVCVLFRFHRPVNNLTIDPFTFVVRNVGWTLSR